MQPHKNSTSTLRQSNNPTIRESAKSRAQLSRKLNGKVCDTIEASLHRARRLLAVNRLIAVFDLGRGDSPARRPCTYPMKWCM